MSFTERDLDLKSASAIDFTLDTHVPAVQLYQFLDQREPDAGAFVTAPMRASHAMKTLEHVWQLFRRDAGSGIDYRKFDHVAGLSQLDFNLARQRKLECVR